MRNVVGRLKVLLFETDVEPAEVGSLLGALGIFLVLAQPGDYLQQTERLHLLATFAPEWVWMLLAGVLFVAQTVTLLLGGVPSTFIDTPEAVIAWRQARIGVLYCGVFFWMSLALVFTYHSPSFGTVTFGLGSLGCSWGVWRMSVLNEVDREVLRRRALMATINSIPPLAPGVPSTNQQKA